MSSESCIHPNCNCRAYKDPGHPKGTLLFLKLGCKQCGHHGSEHRRLTAVDSLVREEVEKVAGVRCHHPIPLTEIPRSPVFRPHDPIPIPYDSPEHDQGATVQCTCTGFEVPSLVKLLQSFRTYSLSTAVSLLPEVACSSCSHTLQTHQPTTTTTTPPPTAARAHVDDNDDTGVTGIRRELSGIHSPQLTLKASKKLALAPFRGCVQVLLTGQRVTLVGLHSPCEGQLHIIVNSLQLTKNKDVTSEEQDKECEMDTSNDCTTQSVEVLPDTTEEVAACVEDISKSSRKQPRRRRRTRCANRKPSRQSSRLREKRGEDEAIARMKREAERECREREVERVREEQRVLCRCVVEFVSSLEQPDSYTHRPLPEEVCRAGVELMGVVYSEEGLVLGLGTASGQVCVVLVVSGAESLVWAILDTPTTDSRAVKSLSWMVKCPGHYSLCAGYKGGSVVVWRVHLTETNTQIEHSVVSSHQDTRADITMSSWAPDNRLLAVGSQVGEVLFYSSGSPGGGGGGELSQRLVCGGSAITCAAWMHSNSVLAVGGMDDSVHVLQLRKQSTSSRPSSTQPSLFSYFKPVDTDKFIHTHWLRGHCSFVSSLLSLDSRSLLSLGWDGHLLFWQGIDPIKHSNGGVFPVVEDSQPQCGFKLGTSSSTEFLPVSVCGAAGFGALVLLMSRTRDVHLTYYTFSPISVL